MNHVGQAIYEGPNRELAFQYFEEADSLAEIVDLPRLRVHALLNLAKYQRYFIKDSTKTVNTFLKSAAISRAIDYHWGAGKSYAKLASFYTKYNQIELSEEYLELAASHLSLIHI